MNAFSAIVGAGSGGLAGAAGGHLLAAGLARAAPGRGPALGAAVFLGVLYASIGLGLSRRLKAALWGLSIPLLLLSFPMQALSLLAEPRRGPAALGLLAAATWGTVFALGYLAARWRGAAGAAAGALFGYAAVALLSRVLPPAAAYGLWPSPGVLLDGLFSGLGMAAGIQLLGGFTHEKADRSRA